MTIDPLSRRTEPSAFRPVVPRSRSFVAPSSTVQRLAEELRSHVRNTDPGDDLAFVGLELHADYLVAAYAAGAFPMMVSDGDREVLGWWSPDPRGVVQGCRAHLSRSLRRVLPRFTVTFNRAFVDVVRACGDPGRGDVWITDEFIEAYSGLHDAGVAHSVEVWCETELVGGLYGVQCGALFAGESMFHRASGASKVAMIAAVEAVASCSPAPIFDVQWQTPHLATMGVVEVPRDTYLRMASAAASTAAASLADFTGRYQLVWEGELTARHTGG